MTDQLQTTPEPATPATPPPESITAPSVPPVSVPAQEPRMAKDDQVVLVTSPDGRKQYATVGQLVEMSRNAVSPDQKARFEQVEKALAGDQQAMVNLLGIDAQIIPKPSPEQAAAATGIPSSEIAQLKEQLGQAIGKIDQMGPIWSQINQLRSVAEVQAIVHEHADKLPYLSKAVKEGNMGVLMKVQEYQQRAEHAAELRGTPVRNMPVEDQQVLRARILVMVNNEIQDIVSPFGVKIDPTVPGATPIPNNQQGVQPNNEVNPAHIRLVDGRFVDAQGNVVQQIGNKFVRVDIPTNIPGTSVSGTPLGGIPPAAANQPVDKAAMLARLKAQREAMSPSHGV